MDVALLGAGHPRLSRRRGHGCYPGGLWLCSLLSMSSRRSRPQRPCEEPTCNHATIAITVYTIAPTQRQCRLLHCAPAALRCSCLSKPRTTCTARSYAGYDTANHQKLASTWPTSSWCCSFLLEPRITRLTSLRDPFGREGPSC